MAQLLIISKEREIKGCQEEGDLILIKPDSWNFSPTEHRKFDIRKVPQFTAEELKDIIWNQFRGAIEDIDPTGETDKREKWFHPQLNKWFVLKEAPKFTVNLKRINNPMWKNIEDGTFTKEQLLETINNFADRVIPGFTVNLEEEVTVGNN